MTLLIAYIIVVLSLVNLARMSLYMITSDIYQVTSARNTKRRKRWHLPTITVIVPAFNEEATITDTIQSLAASNYPAKKLTVIIANDGSTDKTALAAADCIRSLPLNSPKVRLVNRPNRGKAGVINHILRYYTKSSLVMCLDADSKLDKQAIRNITQHFRDRNVIACSSNVNIIDDGSLFSLIQCFEYLVCYQMKRGQALLNIEYIVGGIGSAFRTSELRKVGFYDTNTMTEDIDLTMKLLINKRHNQRIAYAADSIAHTEAAHSFHELSKQRFRWKYGRSQTFLKHKNLFFSQSARHTKRLSWLILPYALIQDITFFIEPLIIGWFIFWMTVSDNPAMLNTAFVLLTSYMLFNVWSSSHLSIKDRLRLTYYAPTMYFFMYILSLAEYYALLKATIELPRLHKSISGKHVTWTSPTRRGALSR